MISSSKVEAGLDRQNQAAPATSATAAAAIPALVFLYRRIFLIRLFTEFSPKATGVPVRNVPGAEIFSKKVL